MTLNAVAEVDEKKTSAAPQYVEEVTAWAKAYDEALTESGQGTRYALSFDSEEEWKKAKYQLRQSAKHINRTLRVRDESVSKNGSVTVRVAVTPAVQSKPRGPKPEAASTEA